MPKFIGIDKILAKLYAVEVLPQNYPSVLCELGLHLKTRQNFNCL